jgi:hypothetical protein
MENRIEVAVYMPDAQAKQFILFQQHYEPFLVMVDNGVFAIRNGSATLNFDSQGVLQAIQRNDYLYSRRHKQP